MMDEFKDDYCHIDSKIFYITENIPSTPKTDSESLRIEADYNSQQSVHCGCNNACSIEGKCGCLLNHEANYNKCDNELVATDSTLKLDKLIIECNSLCSCGINCSNRLVQFGPRTNLIILNCSNSDAHQNSKGFGLFTKNSIPKGSFICEYAGEIISKTEAANRNMFNKTNKLMNYILCVNEHTGDNNIQTFIDPSEFGNIGRYLNHNCQPNCVMLPIRVDNPIPKLCLFAIDKIEANAELTFDYGSKLEEIFELGSKVENRIQCLCKSEKCRKWLPSETYDSLED